MGKWVFISWIGVKIPWVGVDIPWVGVSIYHGYGGQNTMGMGSIYHGEVQSLKHRTLLARRVPSSCQKKCR